MTEHKHTDTRVFNIVLICSALSIFFVSPIALIAQSFRTISTGDGLPQSFVSGLVQDDSSFVWIGTRNGIARFDGIQYKVFQHDPYDTQSLASNVIIWMVKDHQNRLWIEHESGDIDMLNPVTEKITHLLKGNVQLSTSLRFIRRGWMMDSEGIFWGIVRSSGVNCYDSEKKIIRHFTSANSTLPGDTIKGILETQNRQVWLVSQRAVSHYDKKRDKFLSWPIPYRQDYGDFAESDAVAIDLHERANGELMWGDRNTLYFFSPATQQFKKLAIPSQGYLGVRWIRSGKNRTEYLETYGKVYSYNDETGIRQVGSANTHIFEDVKSFLVDRSGVIWMGTNAQGIRQIDLETPFFMVSQYKKDFATDMLLQEFGIDLAKQFNWTTNDAIFASPGYHLRTTYDSNRRLYFALKESVCYFDSIQRKIFSLPRLSLANSPTETGIGIKGISTMPDGSPVIISYNGKIMAYQFLTSKWEALIDPGLLRKQFGPLLLPQDIYIDKTDCWITTENDGLLKLDLTTKKVRQFKEERKVGSLPSSQLLGICADRVNNDILWIGSYQGLICFNKQILRSEVFSVRENLPDNTIYSILDDQAGNLWLSSNRGITRFEPNSKRVRLFRTQHGLPGDEFNRFHHLRLPNGDLIFGGTEGWIKFNALAMKEDDFEPTVAFTHLKINNIDVGVSDKDTELTAPLNAMQLLVLPYEKNTLSIGFAGLEFTQPKDLLYRYKLEGYNKDWVTAGKERQANYTKIPPGNYTLLVNASNTTGKWSPFVKTLRIKIHAPWWASWTAYLCYTIIIAGLVWTFIRFRVSRMLMEKEMVLKEKETLQLKELDDMKSRFFSNITHEFRTPLTLILGPAEQLKSNKTNSNKQHQLADTIVRNAKQLLVLINRLMDLSKLEAKAMKLHEQRGNPATVVGAVVHSFENDAEVRKINLSFVDQTRLTDCWFYPDAIERIVYNLISNALKFTRSGGKIDVVLSLRKDQLHLLVADNGVGIAEEKLPYIFNRYYQAGNITGLAEETIDKETIVKGTGIGLAMVKELVDQMQGAIEVNSHVKTPSGTSFELIIPFRVMESNKIQQIDIAQQDRTTADAALTSNTAQILIVEDNEELAAFMIDIMAEHYQVKHVRNGREGLEHALSIMPDLIISDVMMPVMDGYEFTSHIKADIRTAHIPVILVTAKSGHEHVIEGLSRGADEYLPKPFHPTELMLRIQNQLVRQQKLRDRLRQELATPVLNEVVPPDQQPAPVVEDVFMVKLYTLLDEHMDDSLFGVDQLAGIMNISRSSLHRKLKALTDMSTTEVVRNYRLKKATVFLQEGFSSSETAYKSGFGSPAYFTKCFREVHGITPGDYVQKIKSQPVSKS